MRWHAIGLACVAGALGALGFACLDATEVLLDVRTNVPCTHSANWRGVAISVGQPGADVETRAPVLTTTACDSSGAIGTLAVVPTGPKDAQIGIRVVAGITRNPEDCFANGYDGCIVARRTVAYLPHQSQRLLIELTDDCIGNGCDLNHTCVNGSCTDTTTAKPPVGADGGPLGVTVRCGEDGTMCPSNDPGSVCCVTFDFDAGTSRGVCIAAESCPASSALLYCDDPQDCVPDGHGDGGAADPPICCMTNSMNNLGAPLTNASCQPVSTCFGDSTLGAYSLCEERRVCPHSGKNCGPAPSAPGYFQCATH
jgi:hypothetical protein